MAQPPLSSTNLAGFTACEFTLEEVSELYKDIIDQRFLLIFERLLSSRDVLELLALPPSGYGLWKHADELHAQGVFLNEAQPFVCGDHLQAALAGSLRLRPPPAPKLKLQELLHI